MRSNKLKTTVLINLASTVERMDEQILPALYAFVALSFQASPSQLGALTLSRALMQAISSPFSGLCGTGSELSSLVYWVHQQHALHCTALHFTALIHAHIVQYQHCLHNISCFNRRFSATPKAVIGFGWCLELSTYFHNLYKAVLAFYHLVSLCLARMPSCLVCIQSLHQAS